MSNFNVKILFARAIRKTCMANMNNVQIPTSKHIPPTAKAASVLVPLCGINEQACLFYTLRSMERRDEAGRVTFPGGYCDIYETADKTALREMEEDTGLDPSQIEIWGVGPAVPGHSHFIKPVVGSIIDCDFKNFKLNSKKITEAFTVPLELLCDPTSQFYTQYENGFILPVFVVDKYKIWGMTAFLTHTLLSSLLPRAIYNNEWMKKKISLDKKVDINE